MGSDTRSNGVNRQWTAHRAASPTAVWSSQDQARLIELGLTAPRSTDLIIVALNPRRAANSTEGALLMQVTFGLEFVALRA